MRIERGIFDLSIEGPIARLNADDLSTLKRAIGLETKEAKNMITIETQIATVRQLSDRWAIHERRALYDLSQSGFETLIDVSTCNDDRKWRSWNADFIIFACRAARQGEKKLVLRGLLQAREYKARCDAMGKAGCGVFAYATDAMTDLQNYLEDALK